MGERGGSLRVAAVLVHTKKHRRSKNFSRERSSDPGHRSDRVSHVHLLFLFLSGISTGTEVQRGKHSAAAAGKLLQDILRY
jgi:hypothetical protein